MSTDKLKDRFKLFLILEAVLVPGVFFLALIVNLIKGTRILDNINIYYYCVGVIVLITSVPSLYRRPYGEKGMYRKIMAGMLPMKKTGYENSYVETKSYEDEDPFSTGIFVFLVGAALVLIGFGLERIFNII